MTDHWLLWGLLGGIVLAFLAWIYWRNRRASTAHVPAEDALKHLFDCEYHDRQATVQSTAGVLGKDIDQTAVLLEEIQRQGLVEPGGDGWQLTAAGRAQALRIVRAHRLWERYLADRTGHAAAEWHRQSERREHQLTPDEADSLSAELMHPRYDPHGDPIPTASGTLPPPATWLTLLQTPPATAVRVIHLEDEPPSIFQTLLEAGLYVGMQIERVVRDAETIRLYADLTAIDLSPAAAANVSVALLQPHELIDLSGTVPLHTLKPGETGRVVHISARCHGAERRRLLDLGILPGTAIRAELISPSGDPTAYRIRGALIGLRQEQADTILITPEEDTATQPRQPEQTVEATI